MKNTILTLSLTLLASVANASSGWTLSTKLVDIPKTDNSRSELTFTSGKNKVVYTPQKDPYGLVFDQKVTLEGKDYFVTGWAQGAATVLFRVFAPQDHKDLKAKPICEISSFAEEAEVRLQKGKLEISVISEKEGTQKWVPCLTE